MNLTEVPPYDEREPVFHKYLELVGPNPKNVSGKSDKFWEVAVFPRETRHGVTAHDVYDVVMRYGRHGAKGRVIADEGWTKDGAIRAAKVKAQKKRDKGYTKEIDAITRLGNLVREKKAS